MHRNKYKSMVFIVNCFCPQPLLLHLVCDGVFPVSRSAPNIVGNSSVSVAVKGQFLWPQSRS